ncbi:protein adenylyltransferase SelO [Corynebacterium ulceribovis]|uniref:protein adenylyltransferase SelO n=1 Tax=Corynebacterium ulceribovis TaxID=487732 RepID=UPI000371ED08|nr:protein adenylyltransferase SelO family protein [Corynebacterium ulceribovis]
MSTSASLSAPQSAPPLSANYLAALPELAAPWQAEEAPAPELVVLNEPLARDLGLDPAWLRTDDGVVFLLGHNLPDGAQPVAQAYSGHQFGQLSPQLGDGRALLLGELKVPKTSPVATSSTSTVDIHLKGSGPTPFSRGGDGRAALGPMLREYLVSEAMHARGIPTTRSLAVLRTGRKIMRSQVEHGAVLVRVASSHVRVGTFQFARMIDDGSGVTRRLADYAIAAHYPELADTEDPYFALVERVMAVQQRTVAQWMSAGFVHGVMNTDNTTISGETIDYGPCAFTLRRDPDDVFSSIDRGGRYRFGNQPAALGWNLARFAETLLPEMVGGVNESLSRVQGVFELFDENMAAAMRAAQSQYREPVYVPRNDLVEAALQTAVGDNLAGDGIGDLGLFNRLFSALTSPYERRDEFADFEGNEPEEFGPYVTFCGT